MEVFSPNQWLVGLNPHIKLNNSNRVYFGQTNPNDSFQNNSPLNLFNESEIKKMISQNTNLKNILLQNRIPIRLNMEELNELKNGHCKNTQEIAASIAKNLPPALKQQVNIKDLKDGALLHDFGKVLIPKEILNKNGVLTDDEYKIMNLHTEIGYELLKNSGINDEVLKLVRYHHDNRDNKGTIIPDINLQILNIADIYSALTEKRVYKEQFSPEKALTIIYNDVQKGKIDPLLFSTLVKTVHNQQSSQYVNKY